jgi:hypothetical protein
LLLVGRADEAGLLRSLGLHATEWTRPDLGRAIRGRRLIAVLADEEGGERVAGELAASGRARGLNTLKGSLPSPFTYRSVAQKGWSGLSTAEDVRHAVILQDWGWVQIVEVPTTVKGGRPSELVWVHPRFHTDRASGSG